MDQIFSVSEAARQVGVSRSQLYKMIGEGRGPTIRKIGRRSIVVASDLNAWVAALPRVSASPRSEEAANV